MNILFFTKVPVFPVKGGEQLRTFNMIKALLKLGHTVHLVFLEGNFHQSRVDIENLHLYPVKFPTEYPFLRIIYTFFTEKKKTSLFQKIHYEHKIDLAVIDFWFLGQYIGWFKKRDIPVIYSTHNAQANLILQHRFRNPLFQLYQLSSYVQKRIHEHMFYKKADSLLMVSEPDLEHHKKFIHDTPMYVIPNFIDESDYIPYHNPNKENRVVMSANFNTFQNSRGAQWFLKNVWDEELASKTKLLLVGLGSDNIYRQFSDKPNLEATGEVDDVKGYVADSRLAIIPLLHGSGTRLKCVEGMALKTLLISTSKGIEGIDHEGNIPVADTPREFKQKILEHLEADNEKSAASLFEIFMQKYSLHANKELMNHIIQKLVP